MTCERCGAQNPPNAKFCLECGAGLARACPSCGSPHAAGQKFCGECGTPLAAGPGAPAPAVPDSGAAAGTTPTAERRLVTVLFADLVGFTTVSESRDAEEVRELLSRYFEESRRLIDLYGGTVEKFIGDAVMAVWGAPVATEDDAERAVRAAIDLTAAVAALARDVGAPELLLRAGVLTGEAAVTLGAEGQGMVAGDMVNTASRIQSLAEPGTVLVGDTTRRATEPTVVYEDRGAHELKGKAEPQQLWRAVRVVAGAGGSLKSEGLEAPFVGRDRELRLVKSLFHATVEEGTAHLVSITGVAGIGKSRLAWEFYKYFDGLVLLTNWHRGRCLAYGDGVAYWALADMVRMRARIVEDETPESAREKLRATVEEWIPDPEERRFVEPRLAHLIGIEERTGAEREELFAAWRLFFERLADVNPTVLVFEDVQWADASLLAFIEHLLEWSRSHRLYVITLGRPEVAEKHPTWGSGQRNFTSLYLEPLSREAMQELLDGLVPGLPERLVEGILERAEGVPLYAVETVRMLLDRGLLAQQGSVYAPTGEIGELDVPETLHALIAARLDGLAPDERKLLQDGAVLGKTFTKEAIAALTGLGEGVLDPLLQGLVRKEVLSIQADPRSPERGQYGFLQDLVRRVAYDTLSRHDRKARHLAAAAHLSGAFAAGGDEEIAEVLASHYLEAHRAVPDADDGPTIAEQARAMLVRAGDRAASLAAAAEARRYYERAAELTVEPLAEARLLEQAGDMAEREGRVHEAMALYAHAMELFEGDGARHEAARAATALGHLESRLGRNHDAIPRMERALASIEGDGPSETLATVAGRLAGAYAFSGDFALGADRARLALRTSESLWLPENLCRALNIEALVAQAQGLPEMSLALHRQMLDVALENDALSQAMVACNNVADHLAARDRYADALGYLERGREITRRRGDLSFAASLESEISYALAMLGRWDEAEAAAAAASLDGDSPPPLTSSVLTGALDVLLRRGEVERAQALLARYADLAETDDVQDNATYVGGRAALELATGRERDALASAREAFAVRAELGDRFQTVKQGFEIAVEAALRLGELEQAEELVGTVEGIPRGYRSPYLTAQAQRFRGRLAAVRGDVEAAEAGYKPAAGLLRELEMSFWVAVTLAEHGELLAEAGRADEAEPLLAEAREVFERLRATVWLERIGARVSDEHAAAPS